LSKKKGLEDQLEAIQGQMKSIGNQLERNRETIIELAKAEANHRIELAKAEADYTRARTHRKLIVVAVLVGIFLIWVGQLVIVWSELEDTETRMTILRTAVTLTGLGGMISSGALIVGGVTNKSIDKFVRLGMLVAAAFIIMQLVPGGATSYLWQFIY
jgi:hypothetical protein